MNGTVNNATRHNVRNLLAALGIMVLLIVAAVVFTHHGSSGSSSASPVTSSSAPTPVSELEQDGFTAGEITTGTSTTTEYSGCTHYALGNEGNGLGQLVVQCDSNSAAQVLALNLDGQVIDSVFVLVNGPLSDL